MTHVWYWRTRLPERKGQHCKVLARGKLNSVLVQFEDGWKVVTSRYAIRKATTPSSYGTLMTPEEGQDCAHWETK